MFKIMSAVLLSLVIILSLSGCNTVRGFGQDVRQVGSAIERGAS